MALPGVRTILRDRFYTLTRTDAPDGTRVAAIARRSADSEVPTNPASYTPFVPRDEKEVIDAFGEGSELHRVYLELVAGGAARVDLIPVPSDVTDTDYESSAEDGALAKAFEAVEAARSNIVTLYGRGSNATEWDSPATPGDDLPTEYGIVADNDSGVPGSLIAVVAQHCADITNRSRPVFAVMGVKPYVGDTARHGSSEIAPADLTTYLGFPNLTDRESVENGHHVLVVAAELRPTGYDPAWGYANGAATYAGYLAGLNAEIAPTGKRLFNVQGLRYNPTRSQQEALIDAGVTPITLNYNRQAVIVDGQTFAKATSDYVRVSTMRIVFDAVQVVRNVCEGFIGMPATLEHRASLDTAISSKLRGMTVTGALLNSDHDIQYHPRQNKAVVNLVLQPAFEIRNIEISIAVQL